MNTNLTNCNNSFSQNKPRAVDHTESGCASVEAETAGVLSQKQGRKTHPMNCSRSASDCRPLAQCLSRWSGSHHAGKAFDRPRAPVAHLFTAYTHCWEANKSYACINRYACLCLGVFLQVFTRLCVQFSLLLCKSHCRFDRSLSRQLLWLGLYVNAFDRQTYYCVTGYDT